LPLKRKSRIFAQIFPETASRKLIKRKAFGGKVGWEMADLLVLPNSGILRIFIYKPNI